MPDLWVIMGERLLWTAGAVLLLVVAFLLDRESRKDGAALRLDTGGYNPRGPRVLIVRLFRVLYGIVALNATMLLLVGLLSLFSPLPPPEVREQAIDFGIIALVWEGGLLGGMIHARLIRLALDAMLSSRRP